MKDRLIYIIIIIVIIKRLEKLQIFTHPLHFKRQEKRHKVKRRDMKLLNNIVLKSQISETHISH